MINYIRQSFGFKKFNTTAIIINGGARRDRTADLLRARQALSQLSYGPMAHYFSPQNIFGGSGKI